MATKETNLNDQWEEKNLSIRASWVHRLRAGQFPGVMQLGECPELSFEDQKQEKEPMFHQTGTPKHKQHKVPPPGLGDSSSHPHYAEAAITKQTDDSHQ